MKCLNYYRLLFVVSFAALASNAHGQTLFARPDTTPNYPSYQYIEECWSAALRITDAYQSIRDSIWWDTVPGGAWKELWEKVGKKNPWEARRPESAIDSMNVCLDKFNPDTATFLSPFSALRIVRILLVAHRDEEADRFAKRALDSIRKKSEKEYKSTVGKLMGEYGGARPMRYDKVKQYYARRLAVYKDDSLYHSIDAALGFSVYAERAKDTAAMEEAQQLALRLNDSTPEEERRRSPGAASRLRSLAQYVAHYTQEEALDSLAVSTVAYKLWYANTVKRRVYGGDGSSREEIVETSEEWKKKLQELQGDHYYIATMVTSPSMSPQGLATYTSNGELHKGELPIKNTINYFMVMSTLCYTETLFRSRREFYYKFPKGCVDKFDNVRYLKQLYPDIEIVGLSNTYGTVGQLGPLTPDQNADTLAKLFLGFHRLPARLIVENTKFYHLAEPDGRRIDINTPNSETLGQSVENPKLAFYTDKDGYVVVPYVDGRPWSEWFKRFYEILKNRPSK